MSQNVMIDGQTVTLSDADYAARYPDAPPAMPSAQIVFTPRQVIETLFTTAEQQLIFTAAQLPAGWQVAKFIALVTSSPQITITDPEFVADIGAIEALSLITAPRSAQILSGTLAPTT